MRSFKSTFINIYNKTAFRFLQLAWILKDMYFDIYHLSSYAPIPIRQRRSKGRLKYCNLWIECRQWGGVQLLTWTLKGNLEVLPSLSPEQPQQDSWHSLWVWPAGDRLHFSSTPSTFQDKKFGDRGELYSKSLNHFSSLQREKMY